MRVCCLCFQKIKIFLVFFNFFLIFLKNNLCFLEINSELHNIQKILIFKIDSVKKIKISFLYKV